MLCAALLPPGVAIAGEWQPPTRQVETLMRSHIAAAAGALDPRPARTLERIDGTARRLLALRSYLRSSTDLASRWSWNDAEIARYAGSAEQRLMRQDIERVRSQFARRNPGYTLLVEPQVRSLDVQLRRWNDNDSVAGAAAELANAVVAEIRADRELRTVTASSTLRFVELLRRYTPRRIPSLAAPGLSLHGRMRAVDFAVVQGRRIVAGADTGAIRRDWLAAGWSERLHAAIAAADVPLSGPLQKPQEPWHYEYKPRG